MALKQHDESQDKIVLPHHKQQELCTTRLPYRQGRKLTAVKTYSITVESPHLLIFNVPSLNLRHETKALLSKFGRLIQFHVTKDHPAEAFTETYHALFDTIQSARQAKRMLDTKNFYGSSLHVCYAPELETVQQTREKLLKRRLDVLNRLRNIQREDLREKERVVEEKEKRIEERKKEKVLLDMGAENIIYGQSSLNLNTYSLSNKRKIKQDGGSKKFKPVFIENEVEPPSENCNEFGESSKMHGNIDNYNANKESIVLESKKYPTAGHSSVSKSKTQTPLHGPVSKVEIVDCTSTEKEVVSNIEEALNYNKFGNEVIRKVPEKPVNRIKFNVDNKSKLV